MNKIFKTVIIATAFIFVAGCDGEQKPAPAPAPAPIPTPAPAPVENPLKEPVFSYYKQGETKPTLITDETALEFEDSSNLGLKKFTKLCTVLDIKFPYPQLKKELEKAVNYSVFQNIKSNKIAEYTNILNEKGKQSTEYFKTADIWYKNTISTKIKFIDDKHILVAVTILPMPATDPVLVETVVLENLDFFDFDFKYTGYYLDDKAKTLRMPNLKIQASKNIKPYNSLNNCILFEEGKFLEK